MVEPSTCRLCGKQSSQKCAGCLTVSYCSKEHQKLDWKSHKPSCCPFTVVEDPELGRCCVASRDIRAGELVAKERPLVCGPAQTTPPVCLGCHNGLDGPGAQCPLCGWPLCSPACASSPNHRPECRWAQTKRKEKVKITNFTTMHPTYACITPLRMLYAKQTDSKLWAKISSLEGHAEERKKDGKWEQDRFAVASLLRRFYRLEDEVTEEEVLEVCGILQINGHEVPLSEPGHVSVYWRCSFLEHSCRPNCSKSFSDDGQLLVRAAQDVPRGTHLSICYTDPLWSTPSRLQHLFQTKYFQCSCLRCSDVTEFGTYFSAVSCVQGDCKGHVLPSSFAKPDSTWTCNKCSSTMAEDEVARLLSSVGSRLAVTDKTSPSSCRTFLDETKTSVPEDHCHRVEVKLALAQLIGQRSGGLAAVSDDWLAVKEGLARQLVALASVLFPAECRIIGILHFELHAAVAERARREAARGEEVSVQAQLLETRRYLEVAVEQLKHEPQALPEGKVCRQGLDNLKDLDSLLRALSASTLSPL